jgi:methylase of polypeptide subunit release factors
MDGLQTALLQLGRRLRAADYHFITPTPETHRRVLARPHRSDNASFTDVFGWNRPFAPSRLPDDVLALLRAAEGTAPDKDGMTRSTVRFSTLGEQLFAHSGFPTDKPDSIFFGPDTYRFVRAIAAVAREDRDFAPETIVDVGAGSGAGGLCCATLYPRATVILSDINRAAMRFAEVNAVLNGIPGARTLESNVLAAVDGPLDLVVANPPYLVDPGRRAYRHGGGDWGCDLALRIVDQALSRLGPRGKLLLYTGTPVVRGTDKFFESVRSLLERHAASYRYEEIDPDVFGEELANAPYDRADRIAVAMLLLDMKGTK